MSLIGYDVSHRQDRLPPGGAFYIVKATEGTRFADPMHDAHVAAARALGVPVGHYHYGIGGSALSEAAWFVENAAARPGELMVLDCEAGLAGSASCVQWCLIFLSYVALHAPGGVALYLNQEGLDADDWSYAALQYPLWIARYGRDPEITHWPAWSLWQYTNTPVDTNRFEGDTSQLRALFAGTTQGDDDMATYDGPSRDEVLTRLDNAQTTMNAVWAFLSALNSAICDPKVGVRALLADIAAKLDPPAALTPTPAPAPEAPTTQGNPAS